MNATPPRVVVVLKDEHFRVTYPDSKSEDRHLKRAPVSGLTAERAFRRIWVTNLSS
jgi:hypothetical protein